MKALAARGGSHVPRFSSLNEENPNKDADENVDDMLDRVLSPTVLQVLHPRMASKNYVLDISPAGMTVESRAALLGGTKICEATFDARFDLVIGQEWTWGSCSPSFVR